MSDKTKEKKVVATPNKKVGKLDAIRIPSEGQKFTLMGTKFVVVRSKGFIIKAKAIK